MYKILQGGPHLMNFLYKLERKWGKYAIPNLMRYILMGQAFFFLVQYIMPSRPIWEFLLFDRDLILSGQVWRLFSFVFFPDSTSPLWFILFLMVYASISSQLEQAWGSFNFNVYYFVSCIAAVIVGFIFDIQNFPLAYYVHLSLFLSFATLVPDATFMIYFILPVKAKYLLVFYFIILGTTALSGGIPIFALIIASLLGYLLFFGMPLLRRKQTLKKGKSGQRAFKQAKRELDYEKRSPIKVAFHKCTVCGVTEVDNPDMEFRYCSKCNGHYEYCMDHLHNHTHIE